MTAWARSPGIGGGGRYDGLMAELGGQELSGIGWGLGVDRTMLACAAEGLTVGDRAAGRGLLRADRRRRPGARGSGRRTATRRRASGSTSPTGSEV